MRIPGLLPTVTLIMIVVVAASCAASKEYSSKLFKSRETVTADSQTVAVAPRFLELDRLESQDEGWVDTKIIRDSVWKEPVNGSGEALAKQQPSAFPKKTEPVVKKDKNPEAEIETEPIVKTTPVNGTRNKTSREK